MEDSLVGRPDNNIVENIRRWIAKLKQHECLEVTSHRPSDFVPEGGVETSFPIPYWSTPAFLASRRNGFGPRITLNRRRSIRAPPNGTATSRLFGLAQPLSAVGRGIQAARRTARANAREAHLYTNRINNVRANNFAARPTLGFRLPRLHPRAEACPKSPLQVFNSEQRVAYIMHGDVVRYFWFSPRDERRLARIFNVKRRSYFACILRT